MSFLNLRKLLAPRKMWKVFVNKFQNKVLKLNRSKTINKPKIQYTTNKTSKKLDRPYSLSVQPKKFKHKHKPHALIHLQKRTPSVYVDQLFIEPVSRVKESLKPPLAAIGEEANKEKYPCSPSNMKSSESFVMNDLKSNAADDMWESMVFASPQVQEINERAEEFIARFRAQMNHQEMLAHRRL